MSGESWLLCAASQAPIGVHSVSQQHNDAVVLTFEAVGVQLYYVSAPREMKLVAAWAAPSGQTFTSKAVLVQGGDVGGPVTHCAAALGADVCVWRVGDTSLTAAQRVSVGAHPATHITAVAGKGGATRGLLVACADGSVHFLAYNSRSGAFVRSSTLEPRSFNIQGMTLLEGQPVVAVYGTATSSAATPVEKKSKRKTNKRKTAAVAEKTGLTAAVVDFVYLAEEEDDLLFATRRMSASERAETTASVCVDAASGSVLVLWGSGSLERFDLEAVQTPGALANESEQQAHAHSLRFSRQLSAEVDWGNASVSMLLPNVACVCHSDGEMGVWDAWYGTYRAPVSLSQSNVIHYAVAHTREAGDVAVFVATAAGIVCYASATLFSQPSLCASLGLMARGGKHSSSASDSASLKRPRESSGANDKVDWSPSPSPAFPSSATHTQVMALVPFPMSAGETTLLSSVGLLHESKDGQVTLSSEISATASKLFSAITAFLSGQEIGSKPKRRKIKSQTSAPSSSSSSSFLLSEPVLSHLVNACVGGTEFMDSVAVLVESDAVSTASCPALLPSLLSVLRDTKTKKKAATSAHKLLLSVLQRVHDIPEEQLVRVMRYALHPSTHTGASSGAALLDSVMSCDTNHAVLRHALVALETSECLTIIGHLGVVLAARLESQEGEEEDEKRGVTASPTVQQCLDAIMLLLDAHFANIAMRGPQHGEMEVLRGIVQLTRQETAFCEESGTLRAYLKEITAAARASAKGGKHDKGKRAVVADYSIDHITLFSAN